MQIKRRRIINTLMAVIILAFVLFTIGVIIDPLPKIDREFSAEVQEHSNPTLNHIMHDISWAGYMPNSVYVEVGAIIIFLIFRYKREALFTLLSSLSGLVSTLVKLVVDRPRPGAPLVHVMEKTAQQSFPSGHVIFYTTFFGFIILVMYNRRAIPKPVRLIVSAICLLLILLIPLSRVYLGAHWFTDVTAGALLGLICLYVLGYFYLKTGPSEA
jgi:undecaprenyl-diphosphatase